MQLYLAELAIYLHNLKQPPKNPQYKTTHVTERLIQMLLSFCLTLGIKGEEYIFKGNRNPSKQISRNYIWWITNKAAQVAGVSKIKLSKGRRNPAWPHLFRHGCAMQILDRTGKTEKAQRQLGHASIRTTQVYATLKLEKTDREISDIDWE